MSFDLLAPHYRWMELVLAGNKLHQCRIAFLGEIPAPRNILLLGEGHGRALLECCSRFPEAGITYLDASGEMLKQASLQVSGIPRRQSITFSQRDIISWAPVPGAYDLIITNFFLDCFPSESLPKVIAKISSAAASGANWLIADFQMANHGLRRIRTQAILWLMYRFFRVFVKLPASHLVSPVSQLQVNGFRLHRHAELEWGLLYSSWWKKAG